MEQGLLNRRLEEEPLEDEVPQQEQELPHQLLCYHH